MWAYLGSATVVAPVCLAMEDPLIKCKVLEALDLLKTVISDDGNSDADSD